MTHASLFSGIDGFSLAATWMGWENLFTCEIDEFCNVILEHYHKNAKRYRDITKTDFTGWRGQVDVLTGGFPCQPYSVAGERKGTDDERHLWPHMFRSIQEIAPRWVVGENVRGLASWGGGLVFDEVQSDLESEGYEVLPFVLPAAGVNAPHRRERVFFVAHRDGAGLPEARTGQQTAGVAGGGVHGIAADTADSGCEKRKPDRRREDETEIRTGVEFRGKRFSLNGTSTDPGIKGLQGGSVDRGFSEIREKREEQSAGLLPSNWENFPTQPPVRTGDDGFSTDVLRCRIREDSMGLLSEKEIDKIISIAASRVRQNSIKAGGNSVVPPLILQIFKAIQDYEDTFN